MADIERVAHEFVNYYYQMYTSNRAGLASLYQAQSMLTFEGQKFVGPEAITEKLVSLPVFKLEPQIDTMDVQISNPTVGSLLIFITGRLIVSFFRISYQSLTM
jgi:hypothetical protein